MELRDKGVIHIGGVALGEDGKLSFGEKSLFLPPRQQALLASLASRAGQLVTKEEIVSEVWPDVAVEFSSVHQTVKRLRQALEDFRPGIEFIETIPRRGYRLVVPVDATHESPVRVDLAVDIVSPAIQQDEPETSSPANAPVSPARNEIAGSRRAWLLGLAGAAGAAAAGLTLLRHQMSEAKARALYAEGMALWKTRGFHQVGQALQKFQEAVRLDPEFDLAWVGIANCHLFATVPPPPAEEAIRKALALNPNCGQAYASIGFLNMVHRWDWPAAQVNFERGIQLSGDDPTANHWFGVYHYCLRLFETAESVMKKAARLDPESPAIRSDLQRVRFQLGEREAAIEAWRTLWTPPVRFAFAPYHLVWHLCRMGQHDEALEIWIGITLEQPHRNELAEFLKRQGWARTVERLIDLMDPLGAAYQIAQWNAVLGRKDRCLRMLRQAITSDRFSLFELNMDVTFDDLREDPGFREILSRIGFPAR